MTERLTLADLTARLQGGLIVSCQPVPGGPFDTVDAVAAYARVAEAGGAVGLRVEGVRNVEGAVGASRLPVVGLIKRDLDDSAVRITPYDEDVEALVRAGATVVAVDATDRIFVSDSSHGRVLIFDAQGVALGTLGMNRGLQFPAGLALTAEGQLFVADPHAGTVVGFTLADLGL